MLPAFCRSLIWRVFGGCDESPAPLSPGCDKSPLCNRTSRAYPYERADNKLDENDKLRICGTVGLERRGCAGQPEGDHCSRKRRIVSSAGRRLRCSESGPPRRDRRLRFSAKTDRAAMWHRVSNPRPSASKQTTRQMRSRAPNRLVYQGRPPRASSRVVTRRPDFVAGCTAPLCNRAGRACSSSGRATRTHHR